MGRNRVRILHLPQSMTRLVAIFSALAACTDTSTATPDAGTLQAPQTWAQVDAIDAAFDPVPCGSAATQNVSIANRGGVELMVNGASMRDSLGWLVFEELDATDPRCRGGIDCAIDPGIPVPSGEMRTINIRCAPPIGATGTDYGRVTILSNSAPGGKDVASVSCPAQHGL